MKSYIMSALLLPGIWLVQSLVAIPGPRLWAQSTATLRVSTNLDCRWKLDGSEQGRLKKNDVKIVSAAPGEHLVQAVSEDGKDKWEIKITAAPSVETTISIDMEAIRQARLDEEDYTLHPTWTDPATGLMWTRRDNGASLDWNQAALYCSRLRLENYSDWKLPTVEELQTIYDVSQSVNNWHIKGNIKLSACCAWSRNPGNGSNQAWYFGYYMGERLSDLIFSKVPRALCVRPTENKAAAHR